MNENEGMEKMWEGLSSCNIEFDSDGCSSNLDRAYSSILNATRDKQDFVSFYQAIDALERGCGYRFGNSTSLEKACRIAQSQDSRRLLQIIEQAEKRIKIVMLVRFVDHETLLDWVENDKIKDMDMLFEVLRQLVLEGPSQKRDAVLAFGMKHLIDEAPDYFIRLLEKYIHFRLDFVPAVQILLNNLSETGWKEICRAMSFRETTPFTEFWLRCCSDLEWESVSTKSGVVVGEWIRNITACLKQGNTYGQTLYNDASGVIIETMARTYSREEYIRRFESVLDDAERALNGWFRCEFDGLRVLLATLSLAEHFRQVWIAWEDNGAVIDFPYSLARRTGVLIRQWKYSWSKQLIKPEIQEQIVKLEKWLST